MHRYSLKFYELHDCSGCGQRLEIRQQHGGLEPKQNYNRRKYHNPQCMILGFQNQGWPGPVAGAKTKHESWLASLEDATHE